MHYRPSTSRLSPSPPVLAGLLIGVVMLSGLALSAASPPRTPPPRPTTATPTCINDGCHTDVIAHRILHGPVAQQKCDACHIYDEPRKHRFKTIDEVELCTTCHLMEHRTVVHQPLKDGNCSGCHDPHGSDHRMMLVADPTRGLCLSCHTEHDVHERALAGKPGEPLAPLPLFVHGPVAAGACILCHEPHSSWQPKLLVKEANSLCADCHAEVKTTGEGLHVHAAMNQGCTTCHDPHFSPHRYILHEQSPQLCSQCHSETIHAIGSATFVHGAVNSPGGCTHCHTPHSSVLPNLQRLAEPEACLSCHNTSMRTADGRSLTNMALLLHEHPDHHGPIREGSCSSCHHPHASEKANLLTMAYPPEFYAPFEIDRYALCFSCHMPEMVTQKSGAGLTRFRDGDLNLHYMHVNQEKGRTCRACHEVHASKRPFHVRESVPFGTSGWMLEINFETTADGGTCAPGCHVTREYARGEK